MCHLYLDISRKSLTPNSRSTSFLTLSKLDIRTASKDLDFIVNFNPCQLQWSYKMDRPKRLKWAVGTDYLQSFLGTVLGKKDVNSIKSWIPII